MNKKQREECTRTLEDLVNAQAELILIYETIMTPIDAADNAIATMIDPYDGSIIGKDLHDLRAVHYDREQELHHEIATYYDKLEGKEAPKPDQ